MLAYRNEPFKLSLSLALESIICPWVFTIWTISSNSTLRFPWTLMLKSPISKEFNCIINTKYFIWWLNLKISMNYILCNLNIFPWKRLRFLLTIDWSRHQEHWLTDVQSTTGMKQGLCITWSGYDTYDILKRRESKL